MSRRDDGGEPFLSVIIPAYNEEARILPTLERIYAYLGEQAYTWEMLVALDGPTDDTLGIVTEFSANKPAVSVIDRRENRGKGFTIREGMLRAKGQIKLFTDADNATDIAHFEQMLPLFEAGMDVVIASRDPKDVAGARQAVAQSTIKRLLGNGGNLLIQLLAVPGIWDTQCGFKAYSAESAQKIFSATVMDGWAIDFESLALARHFGYDIGKIAANWINADGSHVTFSSYLKTFQDLFAIRLALMQGKYLVDSG